jgi:hypothetical protein
MMRKERDMRIERGSRTEKTRCDHVEYGWGPDTQDGKKKQGQRGTHQAGERPVNTEKIPGDRQYSLHLIPRSGQETGAEAMGTQNEETPPKARSGAQSLA